ncbi:hypothetical protein FHQ28_08635 [Pasteurellaceae bacterium USgator11]|nr:hypothetical protein FHQ20_11630 [Pasteurellaceae bacterium USgator41]TNG98688.1 hypothetical protein FHQ24_07845 [Pasteurellaceae bacterium UScroc31]TNH00055.1 hypothetical protein FHQ28_08635 [Pasteurellaceae bacterium USgator11]
MMKILLILTALLGLTACSEPVQIDKQTTMYSEICIDGVVYLRSSNGNITPKINAEFYPYTCVLKEKHNG